MMGPPTGKARPGPGDWPTKVQLAICHALMDGEPGPDTGGPGAAQHDPLCHLPTLTGGGSGHNGAPVGPRPARPRHSPSSHMHTSLTGRECCGSTARAQAALPYHSPHHNT